MDLWGKQPIEDYGQRKIAHNLKLVLDDHDDHVSLPAHNAIED